MPQVLVPSAAAD